MRMQKNWGDGTVYQESVNKWTAKISLDTIYRYHHNNFDTSSIQLSVYER